MPRFNISPQQSKLANLSAVTDFTNSSADADARSQAAMIAQLQALYGLQQAQEMDPERLRALQGQNEHQALLNGALPQELQQSTQLRGQNINQNAVQLQYLDPRLKGEQAARDAALTHANTENDYLPWLLSLQGRGADAAATAAETQNQGLPGRLETQDAMGKAALTHATTDNNYQDWLLGLQGRGQDAAVSEKELGLPFVAEEAKARAHGATAQAGMLTDKAKTYPEHLAADLNATRVGTMATGAQGLQILDPTGSLYGNDIHDEVLQGHDPGPKLGLNRSAERVLGRVKWLEHFHANPDAITPEALQQASPYLSPEELRKLAAGRKGHLTNDLSWWDRQQTNAAQSPLGKAGGPSTSYRTFAWQ